MSILIPFCSCVVTLAACHPVPDGLVFRGIQVVARSDRIEVRYQVGISDNMVGRELLKRQANRADVPTDAAEALGCYRDQMFLQLVQEIDVTMDGKPTELIPMRADIVRQQHAQLEFVYHIPYEPVAEPVKFVLLDENYPAVPGYHLAAIRGRGGVQVLPAGPGKLFDRLPNIPSPTDAATNPVPSVRKIEAYIRGAASPAVGSGKETPASAIAHETEAVGAETVPATVTASARDTITSDPDGANSVAGRQASSAGQTTRTDQESGTRHGQIIWASLFAALAVAIALFWIRGARGERLKKRDHQA